jgi:hypothetical protein
MIVSIPDAFSAISRPNKFLLEWNRPEPANVPRALDICGTMHGGESWRVDQVAFKKWILRGWGQTVRLHISSGIYCNYCYIFWGEERWIHWKWDDAWQWKL